MTPELWKYWITQGVFALLFVMLLYYVLKQNEKRETRLMDFVEKVAPTLTKLCRDVCDIKNKLDIPERRDDE